MISVSSPLWQTGQPVGLVVAIGALGGAVMALTMALTTGLALRRLLAPHHREPAHAAGHRDAAHGSHRAPAKPIWRHAS